MPADSHMVMVPRDLLDRVMANLPTTGALAVEMADALSASPVGEGLGASASPMSTEHAGGPVVGWQSFDTAPTDGTKFDAWCVNPEAPEMGVRFTDVQMRGDGSGFGYVVHLGGKTVWQYLDARDEGAGFPAWTPTHWMPRPPAPSTASTAELEPGQ